jgi:hypothetical protein
MSAHHDRVKWASVSKNHRARIRAGGQVQACIQPVHVRGCPRMLDLDLDLWDVGHVHDLALGGDAGLVGPAFRACNRAAGGARGAALVHAARRNTQRMRAW